MADRAANSQVARAGATRPQARGAAHAETRVTARQHVTRADSAAVHSASRATRAALAVQRLSAHTMVSAFVTHRVAAHP